MLIIRRVNCINMPSGISLYVGDFVVCRSHGHLHRVTYTRGRIDTTDTPDDKHLIAQNV